MTNDFEKLGFEINATGNAVEVLKTIEKSFERIKIAQKGFSSQGSSRSGRSLNIADDWAKRGKLLPSEYNKAALKGRKDVYNLEKQNVELATKLNDAHYKEVLTRNLQLKEQEKKLINDVKEANGLKKSTKATKDKINANERLKNSYSKLAISLTTVVMLARKFGQFAVGAIKETGNYVENLNLFAVTFGKGYEETVDWALNLSHSFGLASNEVIKFTGLFKQLSTAIGVANETGTQMAKTLTSLGYDLASFYNISVTSAMQKLQAGIFSGQTKPLRSIGIDITYQSIDNLLKTNEALAKFGTSSKKLDQSQKAIARMILVMQAGENSFGDMANTINTLANQIRIFQGSLADFRLAVGDMIQEPIRQALVYINGFIIAITDIIRVFHPIEKRSKTGDNQIAGIGEDAEESAEELEELNGQLANFDKFNALSSQQNGGSGSSEITKALTEEYEKQKKIYEERLEQMKEMTNQATEFAKKVKSFFIETDVEGKFKGWTTQTYLLIYALTALGILVGITLTGHFVHFFTKGISQFLKFINAHPTVVIMATSIALLASGISAIVHAWDDMAGWHKALSIILAVTGAIIGMYVAVHSFKASVAGAIALGSALAGAILLISSQFKTANVQGFANGGITNANLIMTHENGVREWVGKQGSSTAVVNDTQMSDVMRQAVAQGVYQAFGSMQENGGGAMEQPINVIIDGEKVFNATRKVAKRQGYDFSRI